MTCFFLAPCRDVQTPKTCILLSCGTNRSSLTYGTFTRLDPKLYSCSQHFPQSSPVWLGQLPLIHQREWLVGLCEQLRSVITKLSVTCF
jgi:hypothetical protein